MSEAEKREHLELLTQHVLEKDLDLAISIMREFNARWLNEKYKKGAE